MPFADGTRLGRYVIQSLLGSGGMGEVYLARDSRLERSVALKVLPTDAPAGARAMHRFVKEARAAAALSHPNVAHIYEVEEADGVNFIALEYVQGETLRSRLRRGRVGLAEAVDLALQAAAALAAAHERGITHRDIKPENIMVTAEGHVKVLDFGLAKLADAPPPGGAHNNSTVSQFSEPGVMLGTVAYMSPEQARGRETDARTDVWSLGVVLYELIAGRPPFEGPSPSDVIAAILHQPPPPLARFSREVSEAAEWVVMKALSKDRGERYENARALHTDLRRLKRRLDAEAESGRYADSHDGRSGELAAGDSWPPRASSAGDGARGGAGASTHSMSSAEYIVSTLQHHKKLSAAAVALVVVAVVAAAYLTIRSFTGTRAERPAPTIHRLTVERGLQSNPTWSEDGRFVAYSSDHGGNFDIWAKPISGGDPIRVTEFEEHDWQPDWSPDGEWIVFRSEHGGGGLYITHSPLLHKQVRQVSHFGYNPRWSPDGKRILFLRPGMRLYERPRAYVVDRDGVEPPREVLAAPVGDERGVRGGALAWHPDGERVSFWGEDWGFYTVPLDGGPAVKSEFAPEVRRETERYAIEWRSFKWSPSGDNLYLEGRSGGVLNLWRVEVEPRSLRWLRVSRLTTSEGQDTEIAVSRDGRKLAYTKRSQGTSLWLLPFNARRGQVTGGGHALTPKDVDAAFPDISPDGKRLVYSVNRQGRTTYEIWERSLASNSAERLITEVQGAVPFNPRWSPDSARIAFSPHRPIPPKNKRGGALVLLDAANGAQSPLSSAPVAGDEPWRDYVYDWSPDGQWVLASSDRGSPERWFIAMFPVSAAPNAETKMRKVIGEPDANLWAPRISPDGRWVCFLRQDPNEMGSSVLYVVAAEGGAPTRITGEGAWVDKPRWSPDGRKLYFISNQDSYFLNVYGIGFDPASGRPVGEPFRVTNIGSPASMVAASLSHLEISLNQTHLVVPVTESSGNIWVMEGLTP